MVRGFLLGLILFSSAVQAEEKTPAQRALDRGIGYLAKEVPAWKGKNTCYSCHNNGDAARALLQAKRRKRPVPENALAETLPWLARPDRWAHNGGEGEFNDKQLAAIQFGFALADAVSAGEIRSPRALQQAALMVARYQKPDGSWHVIAAGSLGSPITYGNILATVHARQILRAADAKAHQPRIAKADRWLRSQQPKNVFAAAALMIGLANATDDKAVALRNSCLAVIRKGQDKSGGWGPYITSKPEPFDTAVVLLALSQLPEKVRTADVKQMQQSGTQALVRMQQPDGSWPETTRPENAVSYAHRISTTGWAVQALLTTEPQRKPEKRKSKSRTNP